MIKWQNGFLGVSKAAALGWARGPGKRSERRSRLKAVCPNAMRSFWKVAAFRLTDSIRIQSGRRALRCFQNELHHFIILNLKWYYTHPALRAPLQGGDSTLAMRSWEKRLERIAFRAARCRIRSVVREAGESLTEGGACCRG